MSIKQDLLLYPLYEYRNGELIRINRIKWWNNYKVHIHHYVKQQQTERQPELNQLQKLIIMPVQMHLDLHNFHSKFKEKWGLDISDVLYDYEGKCNKL